MTVPRRNCSMNWPNTTNRSAGCSVNCFRIGNARRRRDRDLSFSLQASRTLNPLKLMLGYALTFLVIALIAGVLGFGVVAGTAATIAKICFVIFLVLFLVSLLRGRRVP